MTKLPTKSAIPAKPSSAYLMMFSPSWVSLLSAAACAVAVFTCVVVDRSGVIWRINSASETPDLAATRIVSNLPSLSKRLCAVDRSNTVIVVLPIEPTDPKRTMPLTRYCLIGPSPNAPIVWPTV